MTRPPRRPRSPATPLRYVASPPVRAPWRSWWPGSPCAGPARGWSSGARKWPGSGGGPTRPRRYWGRPIPGWGSEQPRILIVGLAPAAHGGNRTGRIFTGDRSGDVLFGSLYRCGLAASPDSVAAGDGQRLLGTRMAAAVRCAPPENKPTVAERDACAPWLAAELGYLAPWLRVIVCLGGFAWQAMWPVLRGTGFVLPRPRPAFGHGAEVRLLRAEAAAGTVPASAPAGTGPASAAAGTGPASAAAGTGPASAPAGAGPASAPAGTGPASAPAGFGRLVRQLVPARLVRWYRPG